jgi:hypothetical protein
MKFAKPGLIAEQIERLLPIENIIADEATNSVVLSAGPEAYEQAVELAQQLDAPTGARKIEAFQLRWTDPDRAVDVLQRMREDLNVAVVDSTHSIIVQADPATMSIVEALVAQLDREPEGPSDAREIHVIPLGSIFQIDQAVEQALKMALEDVGEFAIDRLRNSVIVNAPASAVARVEQILEKMQRLPMAAPDMKDQQCRVRIVWLVGNQTGTAVTRPGGNELPAPPEDLKPVLNELNALGIRNVGLIAHLMVATAGGKYELSAMPSLPVRGEEISCSLVVSGQVLPAAGNSRQVEFQLSIVEETPRPGVSRPVLASMKTSVKTPLGHSVVLGSAPIADLNSVFVLQLLPEE